MTYKRIAVGDTFSVELPGKEAPGYGWSLTPGDPTVVATDDGKTFVANGPWRDTPGICVPPGNDGDVQKPPLPSRL